MATTTVDQFRQKLVSLLDQGGGADFLTLATPYLHAVADDHYVRLMAIREYLKRGLIAPAADLLAATQDAAGLPPELITLKEHVDQLPVPESERDRLTRRFRRNLAALTRRGGDDAQTARTIADAFDASRDRFDFFRDRDGVPQVRWRDDAGTPRWMPSLADHPRLAEQHALPPDADSILPGPYLFEGIDLGFLFDRIYRRTRRSFLDFSCALFIAEPDPAMLAVALHLHDWSDVLADPRVFVFTGPDCLIHLRQAFDRDIDLPWPTQCFRMGGFRPGFAPGAREAIADANEQRARTIDQLRHRLSERYAACDLAHWARRFRQALSGDGPGLSVVAVVSKQTTFLKYSLRDTKQALEALGHRCEILTETLDHQKTSPLTMLRAVERNQADLFLVIDHLRSEFGPAVPANLPILTWDQDCLPHVMTRANLDRVAPHDFLVGCSKARFISLGYDPSQYCATIIPTNPKRFSGPPLTDEERTRHACDVSYVSHASQTPIEFHRQQRAKHADPGLGAVMDALYDMMPEAMARWVVAGGALAAELLDRACTRLGARIENRELRSYLADWYIWRLGDRMFRHQALEWVAEWAKSRNRRFRIYGNGWQNHPTLSPFAAGAAENGRELLCIHRASRINLQLMPAGFLHQRALDGLAGGGFFLTRSTPADRASRTFRRVVAWMNELGIESNQDLLACDDPRITQDLTAHLGLWYTRAEQMGNDVWGYVHSVAELESPHELFDEFSEITFDSREEFFQRADRFIDDEDRRLRLAQAMRSTVVERLSYRAKVDGFLRAMCDHLEKKAGVYP